MVSTASVPASSLLKTVSLPPTSLARSCMPAKPKCPGDPGLASYTFSHSIDNASTDAFATYFKLAGRDWFEGMVSFWPDRLRRLTSKPMLGCSGSFASPRSSGFVRAEFFNILNHPNFGNPNSDLTSPCSAARRKRWRAVSGRAAQTAVSILSTRLADHARSSWRLSFNSEKLSAPGLLL